jgi:hypothetical protein
LEFKFIIEKW